ncbi:cardiolipin synthase [Clostridiales bacterium COT073_COT-073]|nr:cardiolipin synthase [Clostridiales bacterium COT073_COT-073]
MSQYITNFTLNFSTLILINLLLSSVVVLLENKRPVSALAWLFFLNLFPIIGFFFYILLSENISRRKIFSYTSKEISIFDKILSSQSEDVRQGNFPFSDGAAEKYRELILFHNHLSEAFYSQNNEIDFFYEGQTKFDALFQDIKNAKHHIHLLYYIVKSDTISRQLIDLLCEKSRQGVEIRFLIDHVGGRRLSRKLIRQMRDAGILLSFFFPSKLKYINFKANYRNHRKLVIIDGDIGYTGGMNVGDEYIYSKRFGLWRDTHMRITGDAVIALQMRFILDWRAASREFVLVDDKYMHLSQKSNKVGMQIVSSGPDDINDQIKQGYLKIINEATQYIYIQTPYFIPDSSIIDALSIAAASGIDVRIMIPDRADHPFVYTATKAYCMDMIEYGIKTYMYYGGFLHCKGIISDDTIASFGTCNFDIRSFRLNFEVNAFIYDHSTATMLRQQFEKDMATATEITAEDVKKLSLFNRFRSAVARLFSPVL